MLHEGLGSVGLWGDFPDKLQAATGARHARHRVDDDAPRVDGVLQRREREQDGGRVAAGIRDERPPSHAPA